MLKPESLFVVPVKEKNKVKFSIILPALNEEHRIKKTILNWTNYLNMHCPDNYELLVIIDGCTDQTLEVVVNCSENHRQIFPVYFPERLGKGGALLEAFKISHGDFLFFTDADGSLPVIEFPKFVRAINQNDLIIGSRYFEGSKFSQNICFRRFILSRIFNALLRTFFPELICLRDTQCGAKAIRREVVARIMDDLIITDFVFDVNLIFSTLINGFCYKEIDVNYFHVSDESKVSCALFKTGFRMFLSLIKLRLYYSRFRRLLSSKVFNRFSIYLMKVIV